jgi:glycosyltransferase involved in cell wall biosynthesis
MVVVPSRQEPFGNTAVEGMLARRLVIASQVQGLTEVLSNGRTGLLVPADQPLALAAAIEQALGDWPAAVTIAEAGWREAQERFSVARYRNDIIAHIRSAAKR